MGSLAGPRRVLLMSRGVRRNRCIGSRPRCVCLSRSLGYGFNARSDRSGWTSFGTRRSPTSIETSRSETSSKNCRAASSRSSFPSTFSPTRGCRLVFYADRVATRHPELLEMELDVLYAHIASSTVVAGFPDFARRIANKELPHGADIIIGIHTRLLRDALSRARSAALEPDGRERASLRTVTPLNSSDPTATIAGQSETGSISSGLGSAFKLNPPPKWSDSWFAGAALPASPTPAPVKASSKPLEDVFGSKPTPPRTPSSRK